jgi:hypothetical protein
MKTSLLVQEFEGRLSWAAEPPNAPHASRHGETKTNVTVRVGGAVAMGDHTITLKWTTCN